MSGSPISPFWIRLAAACAEIGDFTKAVDIGNQVHEQSKLSAKGESREVKLRLRLSEPRRTVSKDAAWWKKQHHFILRTDALQRDKDMHHCDQKYD